tara:strand:+ start:1311 stop:1484 length:174 start_codon:yes stop_codon:yes gene_type:complete
MKKPNKIVKNLKKFGSIGIASAAAYGVGSWLHRRGYKKHKKQVKNALYHRDIGRYML